MALTVAELNARLTADATQFNSQMKRAEGSVRRFEGETGKATGQVDKHMGAMNRSARNLAVGVKAFIGVAAVRSIGQFVMSIGEAAQSQEAWLATNEIVFGEAGEIIDDFAQGSADALGLTVTQAAKASQNIGVLFTQAGVAQEESAHLSQAVVELATDLASFNEISIDDALSRVESGLIGNLEAWRALRVSIADIDVQERALAMDLAETSSELTQQDKILARLSLLFEKAGPAIGSMQRGEDTLQVQTLQLKQEFEDFRAELGQAVLPLLKDFTGDLRSAVGFASDLSGAINSNIGPIREFVDGLTRFSLLRLPFLLKGVAETFVPGISSNADKAGKRFVTFGEEGKSASDLIADAQASMEAEVEDANEAMERQVELAGDLKDAGFSLRDAQFSLADAQDEYNELLATGGVDMLALEQATDDLARAEERLVDSKEGVTDAQENLNDAVEAATEKHMRDLERANREVTDAQDDLRDSTVELADEQGKLAKMKAQKTAREQAIKNAKAQLASADTITERVLAEEALNAALGMEIVTGAEIEAQELAVGDARKDVQQDSQDLMAATRELDTVKGEDVMASDRVVDAEERVEEAKDRVKDATDGVAAAQRAVNEARQPAPGFADELARAELELEKAEWAVEEATRAHAEAISAVNDNAIEAKANVDHLKDAINELPNNTEIALSVNPAINPLALGPILPSVNPAINPFAAGPIPVGHQGGVVPGPRGADVPMIAQAGEMITPLGGSAGGSTIMINIDAGTFVHERDVGQFIADKLRDNELIGVN